MHSVPVLPNVTEKVVSITVPEIVVKVLDTDTPEQIATAAWEQIQLMRTVHLRANIADDLPGAHGTVVSFTYREDE